MKIQPNSKLVMIGDSITDCGRFDDADGLGDGYVRFVDVSLREFDVQVVNKGISGNTVRDIKARWQIDVLELKPDWLSIMIGINDVWRQIDNWEAPENWVLIDEYERTLCELVERVLPSLKGLVLMTPYVLELDKSDGMRSKMDAYGEVMQGIAMKYGAIFVDTQVAFDNILQKTDAQGLSNDRVHMNTVGHQVLAEIFLQAVE